MSTRIVFYELGELLPATLSTAEQYDCVWLIVCRRGVPVGRVVIDNCHTPVTADQMQSEMVRQLSARLGNLPELHLDIPPDEPELAMLLPALCPAAGRSFFLSVVVCTYDRPDDLRLCLKHLTALQAGRHRIEVIVVDNHPASGLTSPVVRDFPSVRYAVEHAPGVACARNRGLRVARGDIVAYIDDDVVVPAGWLQRILAPFADDRVMCVSGLVLPLELEHASQEYFEQYGGLGRGYEPRIYGPEFFYGSRHVVHTWDLGGTANVAIRVAVLSQSGLFDETLGPGQPTGVGEDIYMFYRILKARHICYYEPAAYVLHRHRRDNAALEHQLYNYSKGQVSYQLRTLVSDGDWRVLRQLLYDLPLWHVKRFYRKVRGQNSYPLRLILAEICGNLAGFYVFPQAIQQHRRLHGPRSNPITAAHGRALQQEKTDAYSGT